VGGGVAGALLALAALRVLTGFARRFTIRAAEVRMDGPVLLFTLLVSIGAGMVLGLAPVLMTSGWLRTASQQAAPRGTASRGRARLRSALVVAQVALSVILLAAAGLMIRSFVAMQQVRAGFVPERLITMRSSGLQWSVHVGHFGRPSKPNAPPPVAKREGGSQKKTAARGWWVA
jgi:hypothetical protein